MNNLGMRKIKVLILEDSHERRNIFRNKLSKDCELYFYDQVEDAKKAIDSLGPFEIIFLDHDLDHRIYVDSDEKNTGYQLAKYIAEKNLDVRVIIHTMNIYGAARMLEVLPQAEHVEFPDLFPLW
jgi:DNA-binding NtrC family response regulator